MNWPLNAEVLQGIARTSFYGAIASAEAASIYPQICEIINQEDLTVTYTSFGEVPEPRQLSGAVASTGERQAHGLNDYKVTGTVVEWEQTVEVPRAVIETNPSEIPRITARMARKATVFYDRRLIGTILPAATAGYDGAALYSDAGHTESGTAQDNNLTSDIATVATPTAAEIEASLANNIGVIKGFQDDKGTPVNEGIGRFKIIVPLGYEFIFKAVLAPLNQATPGLDVSGGTGRFRGMVEVLPSAFVATADRYYLFADRPDTKAVALLKNKDWEFKTNIGTDSDAWNLSQVAIFHSYARMEFIPWDWKVTIRHVYT